MNLKRAAQLNGERSHRRYAAKQDRRSHQRIAYAPSMPRYRQKTIPRQTVSPTHTGFRARSPHPLHPDRPRALVFHPRCTATEAARDPMYSLQRKGDCETPELQSLSAITKGPAARRMKNDVSRYRNSRRVRADTSRSSACPAAAQAPPASPSPANNATSSPEHATDAFPYAR